MDITLRQEIGARRSSHPSLTSFKAANAITGLVSEAAWNTGSGGKGLADAQPDTSFGALGLPALSVTKLAAQTPSWVASAGSGSPL